MSKKLYALITGVVGGVAAIAEAIVVYTEPAYQTAIVAAIPIGTTALSEIMLLFVKDESK